MTSSTARPLRLRVRADLEFIPQQYEGRKWWLVKDPLTLKFYRFADEELALLKMLDGKSSLDAICRRYERRFPPQQISAHEVNRFAGSLHQAGLVISEAPGQGEVLLKRRRESWRKKLFASVAGVLSIRFRGFNPNRLLDGLLPKVKGFFSLGGLALSGLVVLAALLLVVVQFDVFLAKLPKFQHFFAAENWLWLALVMAGTKVMHELGHGLVCKRLGGECHEMGVMLLVFMPCLYCNVSDAWKLPNKWHRMAIAAAGMYVELVIAAVCTFIWWFTHPGLINALALNVMFVSSVSTLLFNANPLMRYDGYYILADLVEIPNLREKSTRLLSRFAGEVALGIEPPPDPFLPQHRRGVLATYAVAAFVYRWVITFSILWFLMQVLKPYGLQVFGQMLAAMALFSMVVLPLGQLVRYFRVPGRIDAVNRFRALATLGVAAALLAAVMYVPLPYYVYGELTMQPRDARPVFADVDARIREIHVRPGQRIAAGATLMNLSSTNLDIATEGLKSRLRKYKARRDSLVQRQYTDEAAGRELLQVEQTIKAYEEELKLRQWELNRLTVKAPVAGTVIAPPRVEPQSEEGVLPVWSGTPLDVKNRGASLAAGQLICHVGDPARLEAIVSIDQSEYDFVAPGQELEILLDQLPGRVFSTTIEHKSKLNLKERRSDQETADAGRRTFQVTAPLDDSQRLIFVGVTGRAKVHAGYRTLGSRLARWLAQTFNFGL